MLTNEHVGKLKAFVVAKAKAYAGGGSYDSATFTTADATKAIGVFDVLGVFRALEDLEKAGLVEWHRPREVPGYWTATNAAVREVV